MITKYNKEYANRCSHIVPGATQKYLCMAAYCIKPLTLKHLDLSEIQVRDFWLSYSESALYSLTIEYKFEKVKKVGNNCYYLLKLNIPVIIF